MSLPALLLRAPWKMQVKKLIRISMITSSKCSTSTLHSSTKMLTWVSPETDQSPLISSSCLGQWWWNTNSSLTIRLSSSPSWCWVSTPSPEVVALKIQNAKLSQTIEIWGAGGMVGKMSPMAMEFRWHFTCELENVSPDGGELAEGALMGDLSTADSWVETWVFNSTDWWSAGLQKRWSFHPKIIFSHAFQ